MTTDAHGLPQRPKSRDLWQLPEVRALHTRRRRFDPPRRVTTAGVDQEFRDAVEIEVQLSKPFVIRALGPVLWVGEEPLTVAEGHGKNAYGFLSFAPERLKDGAPIALSWSTPGARREITPYRYESPK